MHSILHKGFSRRRIVKPASGLNQENIFGWGSCWGTRYQVWGKIQLYYTFYFLPLNLLFYRTFLICNRYLIFDYWHNDQWRAFDLIPNSSYLVPTSTMPAAYEILRMKNIDNKEPSKDQVAQNTDTDLFHSALSWHYIILKTALSTSL